MTRRPWFLSPLLALTLALLAAAPSDDEALERNRQRLAAWRADPEHLTRLMRDLHAFFALPPARQAELRDLDARLNAGDEARRAKLWTVLERYGDWLDRLPEETRRRVLDAPDTAARLALIRALRKKEWIDRLPKKDRDELAKLPEAARTKRIARMRSEERRRKSGERFMAKEWMKAKLSEMPPEVRAFVKGHLVPALPAAEKAALLKAEGKWPAYPRKLLELTEDYLLLRPVAGVPTGNASLPNDLRRRLNAPPKDKKTLNALRRAEGWPAFALALAKACKAAKIAPPPLGACRPGDYPAAARAFIDKKLMPALSKAEREALKADLGHWPEYPHRLEATARRKGLLIPGVSLPGSPELWQAARGG